MMASMIAGYGFLPINEKDSENIRKERIENWTELPGMAAGVNPEKDVVKLVALERHEGNGHIGIGFL